MSMRKSDFKDKELPGSLGKLPRFGISRSRPNTRELAERSDRDIAFGVRSMDDLLQALGRGFASERPSKIKK